MTAGILVAEERALLRRVFATIAAVEPGARVILFGSRARGDAEPDSDWDLLILVDGAVDKRRREALSSALLELQLETGTCIGSIVSGKGEWDRPRLRVSPLHANIEIDGIELASDGSGVHVAPAEPLPEAVMAEAEENLIDEWLERARSALAEAEMLARNGLRNGSVSRLYYACFDTVRALLLHEGYRFSKHSSVQSLFNLHFVKTGIVPSEFGKLYNTLFEQRGKADYEAFIRFEESQVRDWMEESSRLVEFISRMLKPA
ncbi:MAG: HEPN domain-containing protein [Dehalococcoidia bacterium]